MVSHHFDVVNPSVKGQSLEVKLYSCGESNQRLWLGKGTFQPLGYSIFCQIVATCHLELWEAYDVWGLVCPAFSIHYRMCRSVVDIKRIEQTSHFQVEGNISLIFWQLNISVRRWFVWGNVTFGSHHQVRPWIYNWSDTKQQICQVVADGMSLSLKLTFSWIPEHNTILPMLFKYRLEHEDPVSNRWNG